VISSPFDFCGLRFRCPTQQDLAGEADVRVLIEPPLQL